jgi:hypothetical protein
MKQMKIRRKMNAYKLFYLSLSQLNISDQLSQEEVILVLFRRFSNLHKLHKIISNIFIHFLFI